MDATDGRTVRREKDTSIFSIPPIIRTIFDTFPLIAYPPNSTPTRTPRLSTYPELYIHISPQEARKNGFSFNPTCLKWQAYLRLCGIKYKPVPSNNHASPTGSLPFLISPNSASSSGTGLVTNASKLGNWARDNAKRKGPGGGQKKTGVIEVNVGGEIEEDDDDDEEVDLERGDVQAFVELIETNIRNAWLYTFFLIPHNLHNITVPQYSQSKSSLIRPFIASEIRTAATKELMRGRSGGIINPADIYSDVDTALKALSTLLDEDKWFFDGKEPGLFDAAVFGYVHLVMTTDFEEGEVGLKGGVMRRQNLVKHRERVLEKWHGKAA